jgi:RNA polymerase sigma-70 factor (ECF subfamily)
MSKVFRPASQTDSAVLDAASETGLSTRIELLYRRHRDAVYHFALRYCGGDATWAEDVTQDVFVTLCRTIPRLDDEEDLSGWFYRVTHNRCLSRLRRKAVRDNPAVKWFLGERSPRPADPEESAAQRRDVRRVFEVVDALPAKQRLAFCMVHLDQKELAEVGAILGFSKSYVCKLVKRAEAAIREHGGEVGDDV